MAARVRFLATARVEAEEAARWYAQREVGLGAEFLAEIEAAIALIAESPSAWPASPDDLRARRLPLSRFPYALVYVVRSEAEAVVVAIAHAKRRPGYWRARVR